MVGYELTSLWGYCGMIACEMTQCEVIVGWWDMS